MTRWRFSIRYPDGELHEAVTVDADSWDGALAAVRESPARVALAFHTRDWSLQPIGPAPRPPDRETDEGEPGPWP